MNDESLNEEKNADNAALGLINQYTPIFLTDSWDKTAFNGKKITFVFYNGELCRSFYCRLQPYHHKWNTTFSVAYLLPTKNEVVMRDQDIADWDLTALRSDEVIIC